MNTFPRNLNSRSVIDLDEVIAHIYEAEMAHMNDVACKRGRRIDCELCEVHITDTELYPSERIRHSAHAR